MTPVPAVVAGRYRLAHRIASGGMGEIFLAVQDGPQGFQKLVALKRMLPSVAADRSQVKHFLDEARLMSRLTHRNIAHVFDFGEDAGGYFVAMEFVQGATISSLLDRVAAADQRLPAALALDIAAQVAEALAFAWELRGLDGTPLKVVHRDISPQNVMLSVAGDVKVIDFGVAKSAQQVHSTVSGSVKGKLAYMSPEQGRAGELDTRSDLFSLGLVLFEMLTGRHPFNRPDLLQIMAAVRTDPTPALASLDPALAFLDEAMARLLCKDPAGRYQSGTEAAEALNALKRQAPPCSMRIGPLVAEYFGRELEALVSSDEVKTPAPPGEAAAPPAVPERASEGKPAAPAPPAPRGKTRTTAVVAGAAAVGAAAALAALWLVGPLLTGSKEEAAPVAVDIPAPSPAQPAPVAASPEPTPAPAGPAAEPKVGPAASAAEPASPISVLAEPAAARALEAAPATAKAPAPKKKERPAPAAMGGDRAAAAAPARPSLRIVAELPTGSRAFPVSGSGSIKLAELEGLAIALDYQESANGLQATVRCEPWAIVSLDGISIGKTPVRIPKLAAKPIDVELRRPGRPAVDVLLSARR